MQVCDNKNKITYEILFALLAVAAIVFCIYTNSRGLDDELVMDGFENQHIYQERFRNEEMLPDAYLRELVRYKKVYVPYEVKTYEAYSDKAEEDRDSEFSQTYYKENNLSRYFFEYAGECEVDDKLLKFEEVTQLKEEKPELFEDNFEKIGLINDMLRYDFLTNQEATRESSYFWYSWYYKSFAEHKGWYAYLYADIEDVEGADELVAIWDKRENLYLMSKEKLQEFDLQVK